MKRLSDCPSNAKYTLPTIGGIFGKVDHDRFLVCADERQFDAFFPLTIRGKTRAMYETGIDALAAILSERKVTGDSTRLWTVENFCPESLVRLRIKLENQVEFASYKTSADLKNLSRNDVVLYLHFNRFDPESSETIKAIQQQTGAIVIEDFAQAPLDIARMSGDFAFSSLRKFSSLDVAIAYQNHGRSEGTEESHYRRLRKEAEIARSQFLIHPCQEFEERFLKLGRESEAALAVREISSVHPIELERAKKFDFETVRRLRRINYACLSRQIEDEIPEVKILPGDYMYLMIETRHRDRFRSDLFAQRVFPVIHWVDSDCEQAQSLLSLHIDQRYSPADMDRVSMVMTDTRQQLTAIAEESASSNRRSSFPCPSQSQTREMRHYRTT